MAVMRGAALKGASRLIWPPVFLLFAKPTWFFPASFRFGSLALIGRGSTPWGFWNRGLLQPPSLSQSLRIAGPLLSVAEWKPLHLLPAGGRQLYQQQLSFLARCGRHSLIRRDHPN